MIAGLLQKVKQILTGNKFEKEKEVSNVRYNVTMLGCAGLTDESLPIDIF
jgi:hypothetical protein